MDSKRNREELKRVRQQKTVSPVPSCVSMQSDQSRNKLVNFRDDSSTAGASEPAVICDFCLEKKLRAVKHCLTCPASYCEAHLQKHNTVPDLQRHRLVDTTGAQEPRLCQQHHRALELFCRTDWIVICTLCSAQEHRDHDTIFLKTEQDPTQATSEEDTFTVVESERDLAVTLQETGLDKLYWLKVFEDELCVTSVAALQHLGDQECEALKKHVRKDWETRALQRLLGAGSQEKTSPSQGWELAEQEVRHFVNREKRDFLHLFQKLGLSGLYPRKMKKSDVLVINLLSL
ncbi:TRI29 protein, partial [Atractosteus spatula]|nr:TRI29 protein [Atractosteus spatula]